MMSNKCLKLAPFLISYSSLVIIVGEQVCTLRLDDAQLSNN